MLWGVVVFSLSVLNQKVNVYLLKFKLYCKEALYNSQSYLEILPCKYATLILIYSGLCGIIVLSLLPCERC